MANLTLTIDEQVLTRARIKALEHGTSVNALVRDFLQGYVSPGGQRSARARPIELGDRIDAGSDSQGRQWKREELYEHRVGRTR